MGALRMAGVVAAGALAAGVVPAQDAGFGPANPFAKASTLPFEAPPFDRIKDADYEPALLAGMAEQTREIRAIADGRAAGSRAVGVLGDHGCVYESDSGEGAAGDGVEDVGA